jgi:threonine/homoserine/homoserine lactone efflux protein
MKPFFNGILTGIFLQLAIGPVFFYILGITLDSEYVNALFGIAAVTIVDYLYIILSIIGVGKILERKKVKKVFGIISALVLVIFGLLILRNVINTEIRIENGTIKEWNPLQSFINCFILTVSSPLTIVFWSSIFASKAIENNYKKKELALFGIGAGAATFIFLSITMFIFSVIKGQIPNDIVEVMNIIVGLLIIIYGIVRITKNIRST